MDLSFPDAVSESPSPSELGSLPTILFKDMVYNRLPFLAKTDANDTLIGSFFLEESYELESCFQIGLNDDGTIDWTKVGVEANYDVLEKSIIADLVSLYMLMVMGAASTGGNNQTSPVVDAAPLTFLKKAKAGSADVEWGQVNIKDVAGFYATMDGLTAMYKASASRKARTYGCVLDICDTCAANLQVSIIMPFVTVSDCVGCR